MLPRDTRPYKSKRPWPGWQHSAACTAQKISSKILKILRTLTDVQYFFFLWFDDKFFLIFFFSCVNSLIQSGIAWIEFLNSNDNLGDILAHLREGDVKGAQLLWLRYEVKNLLNVQTRQNLFCINNL